MHNPDNRSPLGAPPCLPQAVQSAHASASAALLQLLLKERGMLGWLRSLKHWFLMDAGDMVVGGEG